MTLISESEIAMYSLRPLPFSQRNQRNRWQLLRQHVRGISRGDRCLRQRSRWSTPRLRRRKCGPSPDSWRKLLRKTKGNWQKTKDNCTTKKRMVNEKRWRRDNARNEECIYIPWGECVVRKEWWRERKKQGANETGKDGDTEEKKGAGNGWPGDTSTGNGSGGEWEEMIIEREKEMVRVINTSRMKKRGHGKKNLYIQKSAAKTRFIRSLYLTFVHPRYHETFHQPLGICHCKHTKAEAYLIDNGGHSARYAWAAITRDAHFVTFHIRRQNQIQSVIW